MPNIRPSAIALSIALAYPLAGHAADGSTTPTNELQKVEVTGTRSKLDAARNGLSPDTGSSITRISKDDIAALPQGENTPLNQVILQTPGVVQDSYGQLHVRGDHGNVQYRINGVVIPESISGFGQALETRFADRLNILTGALPAQYGYRTAAIVDITTKGENEQQGAGSVGVTVGGKGTLQTNLELNGTVGDFSYYLTGSYEQNKLGIENPTDSTNALHDQTHQGKTFGYLSYVLDADSRITAMFGTTNNRFQIPNVPGQTPDFTTDGTPAKDSATLDANQRETNRFGVLSYQGSAGLSVDYQVSLFHRTTDVHYRPDAVGDLQYYGIAADIVRRNVADGIQADMSWRLNSSHTVRAGLFGQHEKVSSDNDAWVFPADADGNQTSGVPINIQDGGRLTGDTWGAYLQDEWKLSPALTINYGLRYDQAKTVVNESQLSPRLGLVWKITPELDFHAGYARYFTPPPTEKIDTTSVQKFLGTTNALPSDANTAVKAERSNYLDAGFAWAATDTLTLGIDGYYRDIKHLQDEGQFGNALIYSAFNFARGRIYGLDLSANYKDKSLSGYLNLGLTHARATQIETGQFNFDADELAFIQQNWVHLDHEQKLSASAGASYRFANGVALSGSALYGSGLRDGFANTEHLPGYTTVNADVSKTIDFGGAMGKVETRLSVVNLFDRTYQLRDGTGIGVGAPQYGQRRTVYLGLTKSF
ncbi:TonB-dependent receptor [Pelomonas sp. KK5]|uniref:TonB-dependent receptor n=1 Tax=Pelomonas sp. KK5 TaxID=1855730 RepID=UPI00097C340F|nr:TonB-dependent receptor [Pelomonas sp. KK5]